MLCSIQTTLPNLDIVLDGGSSSVPVQELTLDGFANVTLTGSGSTVLSSAATISCTKDLKVKNTGTGIAASSPLTVKQAARVEISTNSTASSISQASITCSGTATLNSTSSGGIGYLQFQQSESIWQP